MAISRRRSRRPADRRPVRPRRPLAVVAVLVTGGLVLLFAQIVLAAAPTVSFTAPSVLQQGQTGQFVSTTAPPIKSFNWDFGDTQSSSDASPSHRYDTPGNYTVTLTVTNTDDEIGSTSKQVLVNAPPVASFTSSHSATPNKPDLGEPVSFTSHSSDSDGSILSYAWTFGDGGTSSAQNPTHAFTQNGNRTVTLTVTDDHGGTDDATQTVPVNAPPVAKGIAAAVSPLAGQDPLAPLVGQQVGFASQSTDADGTSDIAHYSWADSGGVIGGDAANVVRAPYTSGGDKLVALQVTDKDGTKANAVVTVPVNTPPVSDFVFLPQTPLTNETVRFTQAASDPDVSQVKPAIGQITKYEWDLNGDGKFDDATGPGASRSFPAAGDYTVGLRVTDGGGATRTLTKVVHVTNTRPTAAFSASPSFPLPGQAATFTSSSSPSAGKAIVAQEWDFDYDPTKDSFAPADVDATGASVSHAFATPGVKTVGLRVSESGGGVDIVSHTITVNAPPQASFNAAPGTPLAGQRMTFTSTASDPDGPLTAQQWDLNGDGKFDDASGAVAKRAFAKPGRYTVRLRVTDDHGASAVHDGLVVVAPVVLRALPNVLVQIAGRSSSGGARLTLLRVRAPSGSNVRLRCVGVGSRHKRGCPFAERNRDMGRKPLRFTKLERSLPAGLRLTVIVTKRGFLGRYVTFTIRRGAAPKRTDSCLRPGAKRPMRCPS
jgi:PKD repeat protein